MEFVGVCQFVGSPISCGLAMSWDLAGANPVQETASHGPGQLIDLEEAQARQNTVRFREPSLYLERNDHAEAVHLRNCEIMAWVPTGHWAFFS